MSDAIQWTMSGPLGVITSEGVMRTFVIGLLLFVLPGCGSQFKDEVEEYRYLDSLSNPTPAQWNRKREIADKPANSANSAIGPTVRDRALEADQIDWQRGQMGRKFDRQMGRE